MSKFFAISHPDASISVFLCLIFQIPITMAKGNLFLSQGRGKVGSVVFSVVKGQQIERVYNPQPANPRSYAQQAQRALLANMTKFYKRATSNFYKFAFEDKTSRESDYNAFARNNIKRGAFLTKEQYDSVGWPAIGRYTMTKGSLPVQLEYGWIGDMFCMRTDRELPSTVGGFCSHLLATYPGLASGDIVTFVSAWSALDLDFGTPSETPEWKIVQFYVDPTDTRTLQSLGLSVYESALTDPYAYVGFYIDGTTSISMGSVCVSRVTSNGLKVSDSELVLSPLGQAATDWLASAYQQRQSAISWGGNPEAVLAGGQLPYLPEITTISVGSESKAPWQRRDLAFSTQDPIALGIQGTNLKTTAQGGKLLFKFYGADALDDNTAHLLSPAKVTEITMTGSATNIAAPIPHTVNAVTSGYAVSQGFYSLELYGVVIAYGTLLAEV